MHLPHDQSNVMKTRSATVSLGVVQGNPSKTPDTIGILIQHLSKYVPAQEGYRWWYRAMEMVGR